MAGEPELDDMKEAIPTGITSVNLSRVGYMDDNFTAQLAAVINSEDVPIEWTGESAGWLEEEGVGFLRRVGDNVEEVEYVSVTSKMANVVSFSMKHNRYGRYAYAGLTTDPADGKELAHGFGVRMSPSGLARSDGGIMEKSTFKPIEDLITISLRWGKVELYRNKKLVEVLGEAPPGCVSMYAKIFLREPDLQIFLSDTATTCQVSELDLSHNKVEDKGAESIAEVIGKNTTLIDKLDLSLNRIRDEGAAKLAQALGSEACRVTHLNLSHNSISDPGAQALAAALAKETCLVTHLDLTDNDIGDDGCIGLAEALAQETCSVTHLKLALNRIESAGIVALAEALEQASCKVTDITLGQNRPEKAAKKRLAQAFARTHRLNVA